MKSVLIIFFVLAANSFATELFFHHISDTLDNKGDSALDTLSNVNSDSLNVSDTLAVKQNIRKPLLIDAIETSSNNNYSNQIKHKDFSTEDYRNLSDIFSYLPFGFVQDLGSFGQPNEQMFYGLGFSNISYNRDGVLLNNRLQNSYNLNKLNTERIDSLEIVPLTRGFLYSPYNNPVSVNLHSRFNYTTRAVTRLKFYQASYDEGFIDILFHTHITNKLNFGIGASNSATDSRFENSDYESWKLDAKIAYLVNDKINITANYFFTYDTLALFGGLDTNSLLNDDFSPVLYGNISGKSLRYQLTYNHNATVKVLTTLIPNSKSDLTFYYNSTSQEFRQNSDSLSSNFPSITHDNYFNTLGARFQNYYSSDNITVDLIASYETTKAETEFQSNFTDNIMTFSGQLSYQFSPFLLPSLFGKVNNFNDDMLIGYGFDVSGQFNSNLSYYAGISWFDKQITTLERTYSTRTDILYPYNGISSLNPSKNNTIEIGINFNSKIISGKLSYFNISSKNSLIPHTAGNSSDTLLINELYYYTQENIENSGINLNLDFKLWKFLFSNNLNYYFSSRTERNYASPDYTLAGKLYYLDQLFNNNLDVKAGINYRFTGGQSPFVYDFEKSLQFTSELTDIVSYLDVPASFQLDLYLAGTIQKRATIFVTFENLLGTEYYIAPYYFKQPLTLRLGVSWLLFD